MTTCGIKKLLEEEEKSFSSTFMLPSFRSSLSEFLLCNENGNMACQTNFIKHSSEVCHPRCAFKPYSEENSVKKHNDKLWLIDGVY